MNGDVSAQNDADLEKLSKVTHLSGSLEVSGNISKLDALKCLRSLDGSLSIRSADNLTEVALPELLEVKGGIRVQSCRKLAKVSAPRLASAGQVDGWSLYLFDLPELSALELGSLRTLTSGLSANSLAQDAHAPLTLDLKALTRIDGSLRLERVSHLQDLNGFEKLTEIGAELQLLSNADLASAALPKLTKLGQRLSIQSSSALTAIDVRALASAGETDSSSIYLQDLPQLTALDASSLKELPAALYLSTLSQNADAPLVLKLGALERIRGALHFDNVSRLLNVDGLAKLSEVTGELQVLSNAELRSVALPALTKLGGIVNVQSDTALSVLDLRALTAVGAAGGYSLYLYNLPALTVLDASSLIELPSALFLNTLGQTAQSLALKFDSLVLVHGTLQLQNVSHLVSLDGLAKLNELSDALELTTNPELSSAALTALEKLGGRINIQKNATLESIDLHTLTKVGESEKYSVNVTDQPKLTTLDLHSLRDPPAGLYLNTLGNGANKALSCKLDSLATVGGELSLISLARLENLDGFAKLTHIAKHLTIRANPALASLSGLDALQTLDGNLWISNNAELSTCAAKALAARVKPSGFDGTAAIINNKDDGC